MSSINAPLQPGFTLTVVRGMNGTLNCTVYDRAGNIIDLTGYFLKLAAKRTDLRSNGLGRLVATDTILFDLSATIVDAPNGNISFGIVPSIIATVGSFQAHLRLWATGPTARNPDDAYAGTFIVEDAVIRSEA